MKEAAAHQVEVITDATSSFGKGIKKSFKRNTKEVSRFAQSLSELVDVEDILKSIHKAAYPESHPQSQNIIHQPIDWSKNPPSKSRQSSFENRNSDIITDNSIEKRESSSDTSTEDKKSGVKDKPKIQISPERKSSSQSERRCSGIGSTSINHLSPTINSSTNEFSKRRQSSPRTSRDLSDVKITRQLETRDDNECTVKRRSNSLYRSSSFRHARNNSDQNNGSVDNPSAKSGQRLSRDSSEPKSPKEESLYRKFSSDFTKDSSLRNSKDYSDKKLSVDFTKGYINTSPRDSRKYSDHKPILDHTKEQSRRTSSSLRNSRESSIDYTKDQSCRKSSLLKDFQESSFDHSIDHQRRSSCSSNRVSRESSLDHPKDHQRRSLRCSRESSLDSPKEHPRRNSSTVRHSREYSDHKLSLDQNSLRVDQPRVPMGRSKSVSSPVHFLTEGYNNNNGNLSPMLQSNGNFVSMNHLNEPNGQPAKSSLRRSSSFIEMNRLLDMHAQAQSLSRSREHLNHTTENVMNVPKYRSPNNNANDYQGNNQSVSVPSNHSVNYSNHLSAVPVERPKVVLSRPLAFESNTQKYMDGHPANDYPNQPPYHGSHYKDINSNVSNTMGSNHDLHRSSSVKHMKSSHSNRHTNDRMNRATSMKY